MTAKSNAQAKTQEPTKLAQAVASKPRRSRSRSFFAGVTLTVAALLLPTAIVANWATSQVVNTQNFVNTISGVAESPAVQKVIVVAITNEIDKSVNVEHMTTTVLDKVTGALHLPPKISALVGDLSGPISSGITGLVHQTIADVVASPTFQDAFRQAVTLTHNEIIALLSNNPNGVLQVSSDGTVSLPLEPLVAAVKASLVAKHMPFAQLIPSVNKTIPLVKIPDLVTARVIYQVGVGVGLWLPWIVAILCAASIALARKHWRQVMIAGIVSFIVSAVLATGIGLGRIILTASFNGALAAASDAIYTDVLAFVASSAVWLMIVSALAIAFGVIFGLESTRPARVWLGARYDGITNRIDEARRKRRMVS